MDHIRIRKGKKITASPTFHPDDITAAHFLCLSLICPDVCELHNPPQSIWFQKFLAQIQSIGLDGALSENRLKTQMKTFIQPISAIQPFEASILFALGGLFSGKRWTVPLTIHLSQISLDSWAIFKKLFVIAEEKSNFDSAVPHSFVIKNINPVKPQDEWEEALIKISTVYHHIAIQDALAYTWKMNGPNFPEKILEFAMPGFKLQLSDQNKMSEFEKRLAKKAGKSFKRQQTILLPSPPELQGFSYKCPGDNIQTSLFMLAAVLIPGSNVLFSGIPSTPNLSAFLQLLKKMGANIETSSKKTKENEVVADYQIRYSNLKGRKFAKEVLFNITDNIPLIILAACFAEGETIFRDIAFLRRYSDDLLRHQIHSYKKAKFEIGEFEDGLVVRGKEQCDGQQLDAMNNPILGLTFTLFGILAHGDSIISNINATEKRYPGVIKQLCELSGQE